MHARQQHRRVQPSLLGGIAVVACGLVLLTACGRGRTDESAAATTTASQSTAVSASPLTAPSTSTASTATSTTSTTSVAVPATTASDGADYEAYCAVFRALPAYWMSEDLVDLVGDGVAWAHYVQTVTAIAEVAPDDIAASAADYLELTLDRHALAASYGYGPIPQEVKVDFALDHTRDQRQTFELLAHAEVHCRTVT